MLGYLRAAGPSLAPCAPPSRLASAFVSFARKMVDDLDSAVALARIVSFCCAGAHASQWGWGDGRRAGAPMGQPGGGVRGGRRRRAAAHSEEEEVSAKRDRTQQHSREGGGEPWEPWRGAMVDDMMSGPQREEWEGGGRELPPRLWVGLTAKRRGRRLSRVCCLWLRAAFCGVDCGGGGSDCWRFAIRVVCDDAPSRASRRRS